MRPEVWVPSMRSFMRFMQRRKVDLPQPEGPMKAVMLLGATSMVTPERAWKSPYQKSKSSTWMPLPPFSGAWR